MTPLEESIDKSIVLGVQITNIIRSTMVLLTVWRIIIQKPWKVTALFKLNKRLLHADTRYTLLDISVDPERRFHRSVLYVPVSSAERSRFETQLKFCP